MLALSAFTTGFSQELTKIYEKNSTFRVLALQISDTFSTCHDNLKDLVFFALMLCLFFF